MATKTCTNPKCRKANRPDRIHCEFCGTRLRSVVDGPLPETIDNPGQPQETEAEQQAKLAAKVKASAQAVADDAAKLDPQAERDARARLVEKAGLDAQAKPEDDRPKETEPQPAALTGTAAANQLPAGSDGQELAGNQQPESAHTTLQRANDKLAADRQELISKIGSLERAVSRIPGLELALQFARAELEHVKTSSITVPGDGAATSTPASPVPSTLSRLTSWGVPVVALVVGLFAGVHTPINTAKAQKDQAQQQLQATAAQLETFKTQREAAVQRAEAAQRNSDQLARQLAAMQAQQAQQTHSTETGAAQLSAAQREIATLKANVGKAGTDLTQLQRKNELAEQRYAQAVAESNHRAEQLASMQSLVSKHPLLNYKGQTQGSVTIAYTSRNGKDATITVDHQHVTSNGVEVSTVSGNMLPGVPVVVQAFDNSSLMESPGPANGWARFTLGVKGKGKHQASLHWSVPQ